MKKRKEMKGKKTVLDPNGDQKRGAALDPGEEHE
jgi:hypothetical protein